MIITYNGERITLTTGAPAIGTIGVALGRIPRFCGHTKEYYTVLGHVLTVSRLVPEQYAIHGLMHDAQEALVSDVPTPMKSQVARNREHNLLKRIYIANNLPWPIPEEAQEAVDAADEKALVAEAYVLQHPGREQQWGDVYDREAAALTRRHLRSVKNWLDAETAAKVFEREFKSALIKSGLV